MFTASLTEMYETIRMSKEEQFDVRAVTMGINLLPCVHSDFDQFCKNVSDMIVSRAQKLNEVAEDVSVRFGIPIINKRITITPVSLIIGNHFVGNKRKDISTCVRFAKMLDKTAKKLNIDFIGGFGGFVELGKTKTDDIIMEALPDVLSKTAAVCAFINVATVKQGINMDVVGRLGYTILKMANKSVGAMACAKFVVFSNAVPDSPFMAGGFFGIQNGDCSINIGISGPGVVKNVVKELPKDMPLDEVANEIKKTAFKLVRAGELIGKSIAERLDVDFGSVDLSLAPTTAVGDSIGEVLELIGVEQVGTHGTTAALAMLTDAVKKGGVAASANIGGFSGAFIPVSEDVFLNESVKKKVLTLDKLEAMTTVCSVGLDMVAIPGDTAPETISGIIADEMAIGIMNSKTTACRLIPVPGKKAGQHINFGGLLGAAYIIPVHAPVPETFIHRGGRIPAGITSFRN